MHMIIFYILNVYIPHAIAEYVQIYKDKCVYIYVSIRYIIIQYFVVYIYIYIHITYRTLCIYICVYIYIYIYKVQAIFSLSLSWHSVSFIKSSICHKKLLQQIVAREVVNLLSLFTKIKLFGSIFYPSLIFVGEALVHPNAGMLRI